MTKRMRKFIVLAILITLMVLKCKRAKERNITLD
jgi:hypothetical protein